MFKDRKKRKKRGLGFIREKDIKRLISVVFGIIQPCMVFGALCVISFIVYLWFTHLRALNKGSLSNPRYIITTLLGLCFLFNVLFNYLSAVFVHAGNSQELFPNTNKHIKSKGLLQIQVLTPLISDNNTENDGSVNEEDRLRTFMKIKNEQIIKDYFFNQTKLDVRGLRNNPYIWRYCDECNLPKPPRSHHCSICQQCIMSMDHHCPWVASCVGLCNYRYFVLFMFWVCIGCFYFLLNAFPFAGLNFFFIKSSYSRASFRGDPGLRRAQSRIMLGCIFSLAVCFAVGCLLFFHFYLCLKGLSTIEMFSNSKFQSHFRRKGLSWKSPSNNGAKKNWQFVFRTYGRFWWMTWCLPMLPKRQLL